MMDRQWLTEGGVSGQPMGHVHTPVGVVYSTEHVPALTPRKYQLCYLAQYLFLFVHYIKFVSFYS